MALAALGAAADAIHFVNGDRLSGTLVAAPDGFVAIDVAHVGVVKVPREQVARVVGEPPEEAAAEPPAGADWNVQADLAFVVASGNTRTDDFNFVVGTKRASERFDNELGVAIRKAAARADAGRSVVSTKDQFDIDYDLRWKYGESWYAVANVSYFRDSIRNVDRRYTAGAGVGYTFWDTAAGALRADAGVSQVFEWIGGAGPLAGGSEHNPALRWSLRFNRWLIAERLEVFHNNQLLRILGADGGTVLDSDTGIRLQVNSRWQAGLRIDFEHDTEPAAHRGRTDATYALAVGLRL